MNEQERTELIEAQSSHEEALVEWKSEDCKINLACRFSRFAQDHYPCTAVADILDSSSPEGIVDAHRIAISELEELIEQASDPDWDGTPDG